VSPAQILRVESHDRTDRSESLLILSDVHLGSDLNELTAGVRRSKRVDTDLVSLLAHYGSSPCPSGRWRLVIAGDFIDFIGMTLLPGDRALCTQPSDEERAHGLGNSADHTRVKLAAAMSRHHEVFVALARFVAAGHAITIVHGNHDVDFHWEGVQSDLREALVSLAASAHVPGVHAGDVGSRIEFAPWFYYVDKVAYVEHGHQYDTLCSTEHVMAPISPLDPRQIARSFSDVLLRFVVRPTRGLPEYGHESMGLADYVLFAARLGARGLVQLGLRFASAVVELFRLRRAHLSEAARALREDHERRVASFAVATRLGIERLRALASLQVPPVTRSAEKILASVLLDRLGVAVFAAMAVAGVVAVSHWYPWCWTALAGVAAGWWLVQRHLAARRRAWFGEHLDNHETLAERAGHLARLFPAAFVVMGHTHVPMRIPVAQGTATYVNVGSWHEAEAGQEGEGGGFRAARTHLVIHPALGGVAAPTAEFMTWSPEGPRKFS
jgi:UDP-2,3-diacylglucosamine pyrophosphatase LpxH